MAYDVIAIFIGGYLLGALTTWVTIQYGFRLGATRLYQQKENLPPDGLGAPPLEQSLTEDEEELI